MSLNWEPWHEERPTIKVRVITPDYAVHELDPKTVTDASAREDASNLYSDRRVLRAPLPAIAPGSVVEEEFVVQETAPFFAAGTVQRIFLGRVSGARTAQPCRFRGAFIRFRSYIIDAVAS